MTSVHNIKMRRSFQLDVGPPKMMTARQELALLRLAGSKPSASPELRYRLANLLFLQDQFDEAIDVLQRLSGEAPNFEGMQQLGNALLARENEQDTLAAKTCALSAADLAESKEKRARALALLGKAQLRLSEIEAGRRSLMRALDAHIGNRDAYKRLAMLDFQTGRTEAALEYAEALTDQGVLHSRVLGVRPLALSRLGRTDAAREALGFDAFLHQTVLSPPPGWPSIEAFNRDLAAELMAHPGIRYEKYGLASTRSWRIEEPSIAQSRLVPMLQRLIQSEATAYVERLHAAGHPWLRARPDSASLYNWCVVTDGQGFEEWHVHQNGWLSGGYYIEVPDFIANGDGPEGCIAFGLPEHIVGEAAQAAFGVRMLRPRSGLLALFPSHSFHRTFAHLVDQRRICFAFDIAPDPSPVA